MRRIKKALDSIASVSQNIFKRKYRDHSQFSETLFNDELSSIDWESIIGNSSHNPDKAFSTFFNKLNYTLNKHAPLKAVSKHKRKQSVKPRITKGIRRSIKIRRNYFTLTTSGNASYIVTIL